MRKKDIVYVATVGAMLGWLSLGLASPEKQQSSDTTFQNDPAARALYDKMIETMRKAQSLSYQAEHWWEDNGRKQNASKHRVWLKKPNYFRVESGSGLKKNGILVGDGDHLWIHWPKGRPFFHREDRETYQKTRSNVYMKKPTPLGRHSIGHEIAVIGSGMIFDASTFHGYTDSLQAYLDGVRSLGTETIGDEKCDVIEVSIMKHQRSWFLWLSKKDHLPRKLKQVVRVHRDLIMHERWTNVAINAEMPTETFAWTPPDGWKEWRMPSPEESLLKAGQEAPDFELLSADGKKIRMSDYRGKVVWFYIWRAG